mmetsp:Transcript_28925/g.84430  ORF Transcript_28925/g.84430 Transcript_28925/m.84430 type:complete len:286 (+) Transcript_28925:726-1583(+)
MHLQEECGHPGSEVIVSAHARKNTVEDDTLCGVRWDKASNLSEDCDHSYCAHVRRLATHVRACDNAAVSGRGALDTDANVVWNNGSVRAGGLDEVLNGRVPRTDDPHRMPCSVRCSLRKHWSAIPRKLGDGCQSAECIETCSHRGQLAEGNVEPVVCNAEQVFPGHLTSKTKLLTALKDLGIPGGHALGVVAGVLLGLADNRPACRGLGLDWQFYQILHEACLARPKRLPLHISPAERTPDVLEDLVHVALCFGYMRSGLLQRRKDLPESLLTHDGTNFCFEICP